MKLPEFVRALRGQTAQDGRPNKALYELPLPSDLQSRELTQAWNRVVKVGVQPQWTSAKPNHQRVRPRNHSDIDRYLPQIRRYIRKGHSEGRYLIVEAELLSQWPEVFVSPIGVVEKSSSNGADIRVINDYAYPERASVNEYTDISVLPPISYNPPADIPRRLYQLRQAFPVAVILMMVGDVAGAFRHIPIHENHVHMFAFMFENYLVIDLSCGFGWCGSPAYYALAGKIIHSLYGSSRPDPRFSGLDRSCFGPNTWCDDHTCVEVDTGSRCFEANLSLRRAMSTVLGPEAINEEKFTRWSTTTKALGLLWDTTRGCVSIPIEKIEKARHRIHAVLNGSSFPVSVIRQVLGSLRYIATCFPPARAFYQNLQAFETTFRRFEKRSVPPDVIDDLRWFLEVLALEDKLNSIPVEYFSNAAELSIFVYMDASDTGLCALEPHLKQYIRVEFSEETRQNFSVSKAENSINVRELMSAVLAALHWGPT